MDIRNCLSYYRERILTKLREKRKPFKVNFVLICLYKMLVNGREVESQYFHYHTRKEELYESTDIEEFLDRV